MATARRKPVVVVVAIDFGTTYSGYAFSSVKDYKTSKLNITINQPWNSGENRLSSFKTPTSLLLKRNGDFVSYGYKAETAYENKLLDKTADKHEFLYFRQFKMELYTRKVRVFCYFYQIIPAQSIYVHMNTDSQDVELFTFKSTIHQRIYMRSF